jgi:hypothetical protein
MLDNDDINSGLPWQLLQASVDNQVDFSKAAISRGINLFSVAAENGFL